MFNEKLTRTGAAAQQDFKILRHHKISTVRRNLKSSGKNTLSP